MKENPIRNAFYIFYSAIVTIFWKNLHIIFAFMANDVTKVTFFLLNYRYVEYSI